MNKKQIETIKDDLSQIKTRCDLALKIVEKEEIESQELEKLRAENEELKKYKTRCDYKHNDYEIIEAENAEMRKCLEFYADINTWKDLWELKGTKNEDFKYFEVIRTRFKDTDNLSTNGKYHYYAGKRARECLARIEGKK